MLWIQLCVMNVILCVMLRYVVLKWGLLLNDILRYWLWLEVEPWLLLLHYYMTCIILCLCVERGESWVQKWGHMIVQVSEVGTRFKWGTIVLWTRLVINLYVKIGIACIKSSCESHCIHKGYVNWIVMVLCNWMFMLIIVWFKLPLHSFTPLIYLSVFSSLSCLFYVALYIVVHILRRSKCFCE